MQSKAKTVKEYLAELPADRREAISAVREEILKNLDKGYEEGMAYGMIGYAVPHSIYPAGYHCDPKMPLPMAGLASQKNHMSVYLMSVYADSDAERWMRGEFAKAGKKLDMGKCCIRFKKLEDLPRGVIGEAIRRTPVKEFIAYYEQALLANNKAAAQRAAAKKKAWKEETEPSSKKPAAKAAKSAAGAKKAKAGKTVTKKAVKKKRMAKK